MTNGTSSTNTDGSMQALGQDVQRLTSELKRINNQAARADPKWPESVQPIAEQLIVALMDRHALNCEQNRLIDAYVDLMLVEPLIDEFSNDADTIIRFAWFRAMWYFQNRDFQQAAGLLTRFVDLELSSATLNKEIVNNAVRRRAICYARLGLWEDAMKDYLRLGVRHDTYLFDGNQEALCSLHHQYGICAAMLKQYKNALASFACIHRNSGTCQADFLKLCPGLIACCCDYLESGMKNISDARLESVISQIHKMF